MMNESGGVDESQAGSSSGAERGADEIVIRLPKPGRVLAAFLPTPRRVMAAFLPDESAQHMHVVRREILLALRAFLDAALQDIEEEEKEKEHSPTRRINIAVE